MNDTDTIASLAYINRRVTSPELAQANSIHISNLQQNAAVVLNANSLKFD